MGNIKTPKLNVEEGVISQGEIVITDNKHESVKSIIEESFGKNVEDEFSNFGKKPTTSVQSENIQSKK